MSVCSITFSQNMGFCWMCRCGLQRPELVLGKDYSPLIYTKLHKILLGADFYILLVVKSVNTGRPPIVFCNEFLIGSKYVGLQGS